MSAQDPTSDVPPGRTVDPMEPSRIEVLDGRHATVGEFGVERVLPRRELRTVGAWCFADLMGPGEVTTEHGLDIGPHPHIGLQTVTWLIDGEVLHRDSLGSEQIIRPGQLNLMTAGRGVSHSEEATGRYAGPLHGVQLWVAQPDATRHGEPAFEHHAELPRVEIGSAEATILVGVFNGAASPARRDTDHVGIDLSLRSGRTTVPLDPSFEHALIPTIGTLIVDDRPIRPGQLGYLGVGRDELDIEVDGPARLLLIGGALFEHQPVMWWNYVARNRKEIVAAHESWLADDGRFGHTSSPLDRVVIDSPPW
ncbi:MAG: pirin family protein [Acidimicrobiales bacterium]|nr:pirin family protein [Acidimicrobiales bacterium]